jgi:hypothetical protein
MKKREGERPEGRIQEKRRNQLRREDVMSRVEGERVEVKIRKPQITQVTNVCLYCGESYPATFKGDHCPKCATPF